MQPILYMAEVRNINLVLAKVRPLLGEKVHLEIDSDHEVTVHILRKRLRIPILKPSPKRIGSLGPTDSKRIIPLIDSNEHIRARVVSVHFHHSSHDDSQGLFISVWGNQKENVSKSKYSIFSSNKINQEMH